MEWFSLLEGGEPVGSPALSSLLMDAWLGYQRTLHESGAIAVWGRRFYWRGVDYLGLFCFVFLVLEESNHALERVSSLFGAFLL